MTIQDNTFAAACYEQNTIQELEIALGGDADDADCAAWGITHQEWRNEIEIALRELKKEMPACASISTP